MKQNAGGMSDRLIYPSSWLPDKTMVRTPVKQGLFHFISGLSI